MLIVIIYPETHCHVQISRLCQYPVKICMPYHILLLRYLSLWQNKSSYTDEIPFLSLRFWLYNTSCTVLPFWILISHRLILLKILSKQSPITFLPFLHWTVYQACQACSQVVTEIALSGASLVFLRVSGFWRFKTVRLHLFILLIEKDLGRLL